VPNSVVRGGTPKIWFGLDLLQNGWLSDARSIEIEGTGADHVHSFRGRWFLQENEGFYAGADPGPNEKKEDKKVPHSP
jgi:hypothetical protein